MKKIMFGIAMLFIMFILVGCNGQNSNIVINFETNGGSTIESIVIEDSSSFTMPTNPTKDGYSFDGWYLDENLTDTFDIGNITDSSEITLYAKWEEDTELTTRLKDIYELAVSSNSFEGTYEEWLETVQGPHGEDGREVLFQVAYGYIQWQYTGDTLWTNLIEIASLTGVQGVGISNTSINEYGELIITYTDDSVANLGQIYIVYTVNFVGLDGYLIDTQSVIYGDDAVAPTPPTIDVFG